MTTDRIAVPLGPLLQLNVERNEYGFTASVNLFNNRRRTSLTSLAYCHFDHQQPRDSSVRIRADERGGRLWLGGTCFHIPARHIATVCQTLGLAVPPPLASSAPDGVPGKVVSPASLDAGSIATEVRQCSSAT